MPLHPRSRGRRSLTAETFPSGVLQLLKLGPQKLIQHGGPSTGLGQFTLCVCVSQLILHSLTCYKELVTFLQQSVHQV